MELILDIPMRLYNDIETFCNVNNLDISSYIIDLIMEKHNLAKYGDINEKLKEVKSKATPKAKTKRKKTVKNEEENEKGEESLITSVDPVVDETENEKPKVVKRKRNLNAK